jgi:hypothetical protein
VLFDFHTYSRMFRLAFRDEMSGGRRRLLLFLVFAIPAIASLNAVCLLLDRIFFPAFRRIEVRAPVFVIGHARSGTSLLHRLLTRDAERFSCFRTYELFLPSILQKKLVRWLGRCDRRYWGSALEKRILAWEDRSFARGRNMHPMSLFGPEEDEFVLAPSCASGGWVVLFPYWRGRRRLMRFYKECVQRQLYLNGSNKIHCSKNPTFCGKVESLIETFPDARFAISMRNPCETIPSLLKMMRRNWKAARCSGERLDDSLAVLAEQSFHSYRYPFEVLERHPETRFAVVDYRDLVESPRRAVGEVYEKLGMSLSPAAEKGLAEEEARSRSYRAEHVYTLGEFGLERSEIRSRLADLFERYGWGEEPTADA